jgi:hypothetical protein
LQVALIDDAVWDQGAEAVAEAIERIRENFGAEISLAQDRFPEHEPKSVQHLIENRIIAAASLRGLAAQISDAVEQYHAETGANALPDAVMPPGRYALFAERCCVIIAGYSQLWRGDIRDRTKAARRKRAIECKSG